MTDYGRLIGPAELEFRRKFDANIETVWQFLVDPEKRKQWFCGGSTDGWVGGDLILEFDHRRLSNQPPPEKYAGEEATTHRAKILEFEPPHKLAFTWFESSGGGHSEVYITLSATPDGGTLLLLNHKGLVGRDTHLSVLAGWHGHFDLLAEVVVGPRNTDFWVRDQQLEVEYADLI